LLLHPCRGRSGRSRWSMVDHRRVLVQICKIWFAGTSLRSLVTWPTRPNLCLRTMYETSDRPVRRRTSSLDTKSCQLMCRMQLAPYIERIQFIPVGLYEGPGLRAIDRVVWVTRTWSIWGASWWYWACSDSRHSRVFSLHRPRVQCARYIPVWVSLHFWKEKRFPFMLLT